MGERVTPWRAENCVERGRKESVSIRGRGNEKEGGERNETNGGPGSGMSYSSGFSVEYSHHRSDGSSETDSHEQPRVQ